MRTIALGALVAGLLLAAGCMTPPDPELVSRMQDVDVLQENVKQLQDRVRAIELEQQDIRRDLNAMRQALQTADQPTKARLDLIEKRVLALDAAREQDRQTIIDEISRKVAGIVNTSAGSSRSSAGRPSGGTSGGTQEGYDHVVKSGETLSEIARAYKVSVSAILSANNMSSPNLIRVGQKLFIPKP